MIDTNNPLCNSSSLVPSSFIKDTKTLMFYTKDVEEQLKLYEEGDIKNKPDVLAEIKRRDEERSKLNQQTPQVILTQPDGTKRPLQLQEIIEVLKIKTNENNALKEKLSLYEQKIASYEQKIRQISSIIA